MVVKHLRKFETVTWISRSSTSQCSLVNEESPMGLRSRIKGRIKKALGTPEEAPQPAAPSPAPAVRTTAQTAEHAPTSTSKPESAQKKVTVARASPKTDSGDGRKPISEDKVKKHMLKTRKGVLKFVHDNGGSATLLRCTTTASAVSLSHTKSFRTSWKP